LPEKKQRKAEYILRLWLEVVNREKSNTTIRLQDISLKSSNDTATPFAYAEPGAVAAVPSRDISLKVPFGRQVTYILFFVARDDAREFSLNLLSWKSLNCPKLIGSRKSQNGNARRRLKVVVVIYFGASW